MGFIRGDTVLAESAEVRRARRSWQRSVAVAEVSWQSQLAGAFVAIRCYTVLAKDAEERRKQKSWQRLVAVAEVRSSSRDQ
jgi:hypothetical protein